MKTSDSLGKGSILCKGLCTELCSTRQVATPREQGEVQVCCCRTRGGALDVLRLQQLLTRKMRMATSTMKTCWLLLPGWMRLLSLQGLQGTAMTAGEDPPCILLTALEATLYVDKLPLTPILGSCQSTVNAVLFTVLSCDDWAAVQIGRVSAPHSLWQHFTGHVTSSQWPMLHDGAGCHSGTAETLPFKANI